MDTKPCGASSTPASSPSTPRGAAPSGSAFADALRDSARHLLASEQHIQGQLRRAQRHPLSTEELLAVQAQVYRYGEEMELASKMVDKASQAIKTVLQSQQ